MNYGGLITVIKRLIAATDIYELPMSTTRVLSSGVSGKMAANRPGLQ